MDWVAMCVLEPLWFGRREKASDDDHGDGDDADDEDDGLLGKYEMAGWDYVGIKAEGAGVRFIISRPQHRDEIFWINRPKVTEAVLSVVISASLWQHGLVEILKLKTKQR